MTCVTATRRHMLAAGVHPKIAQERLGHSSVSVTIDLYSTCLARNAGQRRSVLLTPR